jgi:Na+-transporting methylmalonyl-CoA/oxaloacetate decarboxylase gamma subunit
MPRQTGEPHIEGVTVVFIFLLIAALLMLHYDDRLVRRWTDPGAPVLQQVPPPPL